MHYLRTESGIIHKWKKSLEQGLTEKGDLVPKSQVTTLQKKVDELERALGRKSLEVDILKKAFVDEALNSRGINGQGLEFLSDNGQEYASNR